MDKGTRLYNTRTFFDNRQDDVTDEFNEAKAAGDPVAMQAAREKWAALQKVKVANGFKATPLWSLIQSPRRRARDAARTKGGVAYRRGEEGFAEAQSTLYGDDQAQLYGDSAEAASGGY
jgi:hypothetical protein